MEELLELFKSGQIAILIEYENELFKNFVEYLDEAGWTTRPPMDNQIMNASTYIKNYYNAWKYLCTTRNHDYLNLCSDTYVENQNLTVIKINDFLDKKEHLYEVELDELI